MGRQSHAGALHQVCAVMRMAMQGDELSSYMSCTPTVQWCLLQMPLTGDATALRDVIATASVHNSVLVHHMCLRITTLTMHGAVCSTKDPLEALDQAMIGSIQADQRSMQAIDLLVRHHDLHLHSSCLLLQLCPLLRAAHQHVCLAQHPRPCQLQCNDVDMQQSSLQTHGSINSNGMGPVPTLSSTRDAHIFIS